MSCVIIRYEFWNQYRMRVLRHGTMLWITGTGEHFPRSHGLKVKLRLKTYSSNLYSQNKPEVTVQTKKFIPDFKYFCFVFSRSCLQISAPASGSPKRLVMSGSATLNLAVVPCRSTFSAYHSLPLPLTLGLTVMSISLCPVSMHGGVAGS